MSFMVSGARDADGDSILASCPFYPDTPLCVNSCALFVPTIEEYEDGFKVTNFKYGRCALAGEDGQILVAVDAETEQKIMERRGLRK